MHRRDLVVEALEAWKGRALAAEAREQGLAQQLRMVMEERFYRPVVTGEARPARGPQAANVFPPDADLGEEASETLWSALKDLKQEHEEAHAEKA